MAGSVGVEGSWGALDRKACANQPCICICFCRVVDECMTSYECMSYRSPAGCVVNLRNGR